MTRQCIVLLSHGIFQSKKKEIAIIFVFQKVSRKKFKCPNVRPGAKLPVCMPKRAPGHQNARVHAQTRPWVPKYPRAACQICQMSEIAGLFFST